MSMDNDPIVAFFSKLQFEETLFVMLHQSATDPELYDKFFQTPELFVLLNAQMIIQQYDPNAKCEEGKIDSLAFLNLIKWMTVKFASDPVWQSYLGWFYRFMAAHTNQGSYWPIKFSPRWLPENFMVRGQTYDPAAVNAEVKSPAEIFKRRTSNKDNDSRI